MFSDHEFVKKFTEAMVDQQEDIFKRLMADSSYQEQMLELFSNPEYAQLIQSQLKSQQFKGHLEESIQETLESPLFKATVSEIIIQHAKKLLVKIVVRENRNQQAVNLKMNQVVNLSKKEAPLF